MRSYSVKENHIGSVVNEILRYKHSEILRARVRECESEKERWIDKKLRRNIEKEREVKVAIKQWRKEEEL